MRAVIEPDRRIAFAVLFGSTARETSHPTSDLDVAIGLTHGAEFGRGDIGGLVSRLESELARSVDLVMIDEAAPRLAYRVFRDGVIVFERDHRALAMRKATAILEYLDFLPVEEQCARGVLEAASGR